jgi:GcrA cell cycle regulator
MPAPIGNRNGKQVWTVEYDEALKACLSEGFSCAESALYLGDTFGRRFTKNMVIGRMHRKGFSQMAKLSRKDGNSRRKTIPPVTDVFRITKRSPLPRAPIVTQAPVCEAIEPGRVTLLQLRDDICHWPLGGWPANSPVTFCGAPRCQEHESYCFAHYERSTGTGTWAEQAAHRVSEKVA